MKLHFERLTPRGLFILLLAISHVGCREDKAIRTDSAAKVQKHQLTDDELRDELDEVLDFTFRRELRAETNAAWQIVHGIMAFGPEYQISVDGKSVPALDWLLKGGNLRGWNLEPGDKGLRAIMEAGSKTGQGHQDQWLGYLSHCELPPDQEIVVGGQIFQLADLLQQAQWDIRPRQEYSWTLMGLSSYLPADQTWTSSDGSTWDLEKIIRLEADYDLSTSACGGTHRLYGMTLALRHFRNQYPDDPLRGGWEAAQNKISQSIAKAKEYQQPNGAFSTNYFQRPGNSSLIGVQLGSTGHTLEFLTLAVTEEELRAPWMTQAALFLCKLLRATKDEPLECGALFHAAHGLHLYRTRRFGPRTYGNVQDGNIVSQAETTSLESPPGP